jgi:hypothetical protein
VFSWRDGQNLRKSLRVVELSQAFARGPAWTTRDMLYVALLVQVRTPSNEDFAQISIL